jgi:hypothetical protein
MPAVLIQHAVNSNINTRRRERTCNEGTEAKLIEIKDPS